ncbi:MAG: tRNA 2-thiocytidine(32) synthetase TtcA [Desulfobacterales bacterium CG23_combo_of_CG06-09_8_20_14_all_51_8]|nr:MAG: tRNA 2-thiocytidine(32) synthetase TtcA [Desulfobacterales bacterium CG23_combo_of_CG06-09_8_20_14_all_51_8]
MSPYQLKIFRRDVGKAISHYDMIADGDRILVAVSGGKDSLTLLWMLNERLSWIPIRYSLFPVYIDPGFPGGFADSLCEFVKRMGFDLRVAHTNCGIQAHSASNRENPCFLCARLRRKRLFEIAGELDCRKIALGHHKDDIIETFFINVCYAGNISTMRPMQPFFKGKISVIRPLAYVEENRIRRIAKDREFPEFVNPCPTAAVSRRKEIKEILNRLYESNKKIRGNIFRALQNVNPDYLL